jgi:hypothetical protein
MAVMGFAEALAKEVSHMAEYDEDQIADICSKKEVVGGRVLNGVWKVITLESAGVEMVLRQQRAELGT